VDERQTSRRNKMERISEDISGSEPVSASDQEPTSKDTILFARNIAKMFQDLNRGHHKKLHEFIAEGASTFIKLKNDDPAYELFKKEKFWIDSDKTLKGPCKASDVFIYLTGATSRDARRQAGKYARAVDYMISKRVNDYETHLNRFGVEKLVESARDQQNAAKGQPKPSATQKKGAPPKDIPKQEKDENSRWAFVGGRMLPRVYRNLGAILKNCPAEVEFTLNCRAGPGPNPVITMYRSPVTEVGQFPLGGRYWSEYRKRQDKMVAAEEELVKAAKSQGRKKA
jgi:hypothetical protein